MERTINKIDSSKIKAGDIMATINWVLVKKVVSPEVVMVDDLDDRNLNNIELRGKSLIESCFSANLFAEENKITKTQAAEILVSSYNRPFTVCFDKQADSKTGKSEERILRGRLIHPEPLLGRSQVEDLDIEKGEYRTRLVDHRTIKWIIVDGIKYSVK